MANTNNIEQYEEDSDDFNNRGNILCILWKNGKLAASYYNLIDKLLFVYEEMVDLGPQFMKMRCLYREVQPKFLISIGHITDDYIKVLIDVMSPIDEDSTITTDTLRSLPPNFFLLANGREYSYEICKGVLSELVLASNPDVSDNEKELYLQSLMNFDYKMSVHAVGCLIKYIEKNWAFFLDSKDDLQFLHIHERNLRGYVLVDQNSLNAFQLFRQNHHDSSFRRGMQNSNREGLSLFRLFSGSCKSKIGFQALRNLLINPINDIHELNKRLDFINFTLTPVFKEYVESLQDNIAVLSDISDVIITERWNYPNIQDKGEERIYNKLILTKVQNTRATAKDWNVLYKTIYHTIFMQEITAPYKDQSLLLYEFYNSVTMNLIILENSINKAIDFTNISGRPEIKMGLDEELDAKKLHRQDMSKYLSAAAKFAVEQFPDYLKECEVVYLPEMGHLITVKKWTPDCDPNDLQPLGFEFMFTLGDVLHFKSPLCEELNETLGDINAKIIDHENRILQRLSGFVLKYNTDIRKPLQVIAQMDALMSMAKVASDNNYVRPNLNNDNVHEIRKCRHPLMEQVSHFEPNDFYSGGNYSHMKIITGPNGSGKSVYLRQIALAIYLAHVGSYIPAKEANIGMLHSIHTRMQAAESASVRLSAFMIDMVQMTQALHNAKSNSLILLDEFGRGTTGREGFSILIGTLQKYYDQGEFCPHIVVSTHYQKISSYIPQSRLVDHLKMTHTKEGDTFLFLYKLAKGISNSYAFEIARECGLAENIIQRASQIFQSIQNNQVVCPVRELERYNREAIGDLENFLTQIDVPELDEEDQNAN